MNHENRAHAKLSASGSKQWLTCTPSIKLSEGLPDRTSADAELGTKAHELAENRLRWMIYKDVPLIDADREMVDYIGIYTGYVMERYHAALSETLDAVIMLEQRLDFSKYVPDGFGTGDTVIVSDGVLEIIDLKYGIGVPVHAIGNTQLQLYALGAVERYYTMYAFHTVRVTIVQPRLDSISSWDIDVLDLENWAIEYVKPRAELAAKGEGELVSGSHCRFCKARFLCRKRAEDNLEMAKLEFRNADLLTDDELNEILLRADDLAKWVKDVKEYVTERIQSGLELSGWEVTPSVAKRKVTAPDDAAQALKRLGYREDEIFTTELKGIGALEKLVGKKEFSTVLGEYVEKVEGAPTLKRRNGEK